MSSKCCFLYVLRLKPGCYYYIGTTTRTFKERLQEHLDGYGSKWSTKHGVHSVVSDRDPDCGSTKPPLSICGAMDVKTCAGASTCE